MVSLVGIATFFYKDSYRLESKIVNMFLKYQYVSNKNETKQLYLYLSKYIESKINKYYWNIAICQTNIKNKNAFISQI